MSVFEINQLGRDDDDRREYRANPTGGSTFAYPARLGDRPFERFTRGRERVDLESGCSPVVAIEVARLSLYDRTNRPPTILSVTEAQYRALHEDKDIRAILDTLGRSWLGDRYHGLYLERRPDDDLAGVAWVEVELGR